MMMMKMMMIDFMEVLAKREKEDTAIFSRDDFDDLGRYGCFSSFTAGKALEKEINLSLSLSHPNPNPNPAVLGEKRALPIDLDVNITKDPSFCLSLFPLTSNPNPNQKLEPDNYVNTVETEDPPLSLSLSLPSSNPNPKPVVLGVKRALLIDVKVEEKTLKRARTTVGIPRRLPINFPAYFPQIPAEFREKIMELGGTHHPKLVLEKTLFATDVNRVNSRLSLPQGKCTIELTYDEMIDANRRNVYKQVVGFEVMVIDPNCGLRRMNFRRWGIVNSYVLVRKWNNVVQDNGLEQGNTLQIWSFRYGPRDRLGLALVKLND